MDLTKKKRLIWDWNGTLLDDALLTYRVAELMLSDRKLPPLGSFEAFREKFGFPIIDFYRQIGFTFKTETFEDSAADFHRYYNAEADNCPLFPDALPTLRTLQDGGFIHHLLSVSELTTLTRQAAERHALPYFTSVHGQTHGLSHGKTHMAKDLIAGLPCAPEEILFIGDTDHDALCARSVGCDCLLIHRGNQSKARLEQCGYPVIGSLEELLPLFGV